jgi:hypothetical protein
MFCFFDKFVAYSFYFGSSHPFTKLSSERKHFVLIEKFCGHVFGIYFLFFKPLRYARSLASPQPSPNGEGVRKGDNY